MLESTNADLYLTPKVTFPEPTFERVRGESNCIWQKIHTSDFFKRVVQAAVDVTAGAVFIAALFPVSIVLTAVSFVALIALGLATPALLHPETAKVWRTVRNKIFGLLTDLQWLPHAVLVTPLAFEPNASMVKVEENKPLVVFVHGFAHNKTCWERLTNKICRETEDSALEITERDIYAINLGEPLTTKQIDFYARYLATKLEQIRKTRGVEKLDVVVDCHSMGGLVAAQFLEYAPEAGINVTRLISNGTPWHGTPAAYTASAVACGREMTPDHEYQKGLIENVNRIKERVFVIASKGDTIVPYHSALGVKLDIPEDHRFTLSLPYGHLAMLESPEGQALNTRLITEAIAGKI